MDNLIWTNNEEKRFEDLLKEYGEKADKIFIASAFFSETKLLTEWTNADKKIELLISLKPQTNYDSIKEIYLDKNIYIRFLGNEFHSKFYVFFKNQKPYACIIGSSNFTGGGLRKNIETNVILTSSNYLNDIEKQISEFETYSELLEDSDLEKFKLNFDNYQTTQKNAKPIPDIYKEKRRLKQEINDLLTQKISSDIILDNNIICTRYTESKSADNFWVDKNRGRTAMCINCIKVHHTGSLSIAQFVKDSGKLLYDMRVVEGVDTAEKADLYARRNGITLVKVNTVKMLFTRKWRAANPDHS